MDGKAWRYGCLFCQTNAEAIIAGYINQTITDVEAAAPTRTRRKTVAGKAIEDQVQLLPGYIFFRVESDESIPRLPLIANVLKSLEYDNLSWELTGGDREFAEFLLDNGLLQLSQVTFIDGRIHFEDGFLYGLDDAMLCVNRRKRTAEIKLEIDRLALWLGYTRRSKDITENERKRCLPWQGGRYGGFLDFESEGVRYRITRMMN